MNLIIYLILYVIIQSRADLIKKLCFYVGEYLDYKTNIEKSEFPPAFQNINYKYKAKNVSIQCDSNNIELTNTITNNKQIFNFDELNNIKKFIDNNC